MKKIKIDRAIQERPATRKQTRNEKIRQSLTEHVDVQVIPAITDREGYEKPKLRVCAYCRVSTDMDTQALSYELQVQNYTDYIRGNDEWQFAGIYADRGISGTSLKHRDEFNRMIEDCKAGKIDLIITKAVTRFARNVLDCISTIRMEDEATLKRFYPEPKKHRIRLHPENSRMDDIYVDNCEIQGVAVKVLKDLE